MDYLLVLYFSFSITAVHYDSKSACEEASDYYHIHYGEELTKSDCLPIELDE